MANDEHSGMNERMTIGGKYSIGGTFSFEFYRAARERSRAAAAAGLPDPRYAVLAHRRHQAQIVARHLLEHDTGPYEINGLPLPEAWRPFVRRG
jgi:hypothetical protein